MYPFNESEALDLLCSEPNHLKYKPKCLRCGDNECLDNILAVKYDFKDDVNLVLIKCNKNILNNAIKSEFLRIVELKNKVDTSCCTECGSSNIKFCQLETICECGDSGIPTDASVFYNRQVILSVEGVDNIPNLMGCGFSLGIIYCFHCKLNVLSWLWSDDTSYDDKYYIYDNEPSMVLQKRYILDNNILDITGLKKELEIYFKVNSEHHRKSKKNKNHKSGQISYLWDYGLEDIILGNLKIRLLLECSEEPAHDELLEGGAVEAVFRVDEESDEALQIELPQKIFIPSDYKFEPFPIHIQQIHDICKDLIFEFDINNTYEMLVRILLVSSSTYQPIPDTIEQTPRYILDGYNTTNYNKTVIDKNKYEYLVTFGYLLPGNIEKQMRNYLKEDNCTQNYHLQHNLHIGDIRIQFHTKELTYHQFNLPGFTGFYESAIKHTWENAVREYFQGKQYKCKRKVAVVLSRDTKVVIFRP